jgi:hypothetical protein
MEFLSPKTKERIAKLEAENAELQRQLIEQKGSSSKKTSWPLTVVLVVITALVTYQFLGNSSMSEEELTQKSVELWRGGQAVDTVFAANDELVFSVQIGSFKNQSVKELSYGLSEASMVEKDSLVLFVLGEYNSLPDAQQALALVINLGVENAFIVAQKNGKAVGLLTEQNRE